MTEHEDTTRRFAEIQARADALTHYEASPNDGPKRPANRSIRIEQANREIERHAVEDISWLLDRLAAVRREERQEARGGMRTGGVTESAAKWKARAEAAEAALAAERAHRERLEAEEEARYRLLESAMWAELLPAIGRDATAALLKRSLGSIFPAVSATREGASNGDS